MTRMAAAVAAAVVALLVALLAAVLPAGPDGGAVAASAAELDAHTNLPLSFVPNRGQSDPRVRYQASAGGAGFFFTRRKAVVSLPPDRARGRGFALELRFLGASPDARISAERPAPGTVSYLRGDDPSRWQRGLPAYAQVSYTSLWPGIDMSFRGRDGRLKYEFVVEPAARPGAIGLSYAGAESLSVSRGGSLLVRTERGTLTDAAPVAYQRIRGRRVAVRARYELRGGTRYGFALGAYDRSRPLVIDPGLAYSTFLGGPGIDEGAGVAVDASGNAYVVGTAAAGGFPTTAGAFDTTDNGSSDVFVTKLNTTGTAPVYSTFLGGEGFDQALAVAVDSSGAAYVTGDTASDDFPTIAESFETAPFGGGDAFVTKLNATGTGLSYSTYLGGNLSDSGRGIAVDTSGSAYVAGAANSADFPTTTGAADTSHGGSTDAFVAKLSATGGGLTYSTYLGGSSFDYANGIALRSGEAHLTGVTASTDFATTAGAYDTTHNDQSDVFVTKLAANGGSFGYSTYLGGSGFDLGNGIAVDSLGNAHVAGSTGDPGSPPGGPTAFPTTAGAFDTSHGGSTDAFVSKLNTTGSALSHSTFLGGPGSDDARAIALGGDGSSVTGLSEGGVPTTPDAFDTSHNGGQDAFATELTATADALVDSTYLGGPGSDRGTSIASVPDGGAHVVGNTESSGFPTTSGAFDSTHNGSRDVFVAKLDLGAAPDETADLALTKSDSPDPVTVGQTLTYELTVENDGPDGAGDVVVTDTLPASVTIESLSEFCAESPPASGTVTCDVGHVSANDTSTFEIQVTPNEPGEITNSAEVASGEASDPDGDNNSAAVDTTVEGAPAEQFVLTVDKDGSGTGSVTSAPPGIDCGGDCSEDYDEGTLVDLTATPDPGSELGGWEGACGAVSGNTCSDVPMSQDHTVRATFDAAPDTGGGGSGGGVGTAPAGGGGGAPPVADFSFKARSPTVRGAVRLNGASSLAAQGRNIVSYAWDLTSDGRSDFVAAGNTPAISTTIRRPGSYTATLQVTDSAGQRDTIARPYSVGRGAINRGRSFAAFERPADGPNQGNTPGCVKTIAFAIVEVNGRGGPSQCFRLQYANRALEFNSRGRFGTAEAAQGPFGRRLQETVVLYRAEIDGPVALNGLPIPLPAGHTSRYEAWQGRVELGRVGIALPLPNGTRVRLAEANLGFDVPSQGSRRLPALTTSSLPGFAGLKLGGSVDVVLRRAVADISVGLTLPNFLSDPTGNPIQAGLKLSASNTGGVRLASAGLEVPEAFIGPLRVDSVSLRYGGPPEETLQAAANFRFPSLEILGAPPEARRGIGLRRGAFDYAGLKVEFPFGFQPKLFPGIFLSRVEGRFQVNPIAVSGNVGINAAKVVGIDGSLLLALATPRRPFNLPRGTALPGLGAIEERPLTSFAFAVGGQGSLLTPVGSIPFGNAHVFYHYPDFIELGGDFKFRLGGGSAPYFELRGGVGGWATFDPARFNLEGGQEACVGIPFLIDDVELCQGVNGLVSSAGFHACVKNIRIPVPPFFVPEIGLGHRWGSGPVPDFTLFGCYPSEYREARPLGNGRSARAHAAQAQGFVIPRGLPSAQVRVTGDGGPPAVDVRGPDGTEVNAPLEGEQAPNTAGEDFVAMRVDPSTVQIALRRPAAGRWTVTPRGGSAPIARVAVANGLPDVRVRARVTGRGRNRVLRYLGVQPGAGRRVRFVEQGVRTYREIGVARRRAGAIRFAPARGARGRRRIMALVEQGGLTVDRIDVARYSAPPDARPPKPRRLRVRRRGGALLVRWRRVRGVRSYGVVVQLSNRRRIFRIAERPRLKLRGFHRRVRGRVVVQSLQAGGRTSRPARARIRVRARVRRR